jgi:two-component system cell cycle response regulator
VAAPETAASAEPSAVSKATTTSTVLIVDDNAQNVELLQAFLESLPVKIVTAVDGIDALAKVTEHHPDLILLDVMMPRMSGFQVCQKLKSDPKTRDILILMVTALHELGDIERASECGTDDFVSKPVNKVELQTRVKLLLRLRDLATAHERQLRYISEIEQDHEG